MLSSDSCQVAGARNALLLLSFYMWDQDTKPTERWYATIIKTSKNATVSIEPIPYVKHNEN